MFAEALAWVSCHVPLFVDLFEPLDSELIALAQDLEDGDPWLVEDDVGVPGGGEQLCRLGVRREDLRCQRLRPLLVHPHELDEPLAEDGADRQRRIDRRVEAAIDRAGEFGQRIDALEGSIGLKCPLDPKGVANRRVHGLAANRVDRHRGRIVILISIGRGVGVLEKRLDDVPDAGTFLRRDFGVARVEAFGEQADRRSPHPV